MSRERAIRFTTDPDIINNQIPILVDDTLGKVFYQSERRAKRVRGEDGQMTDEISALSIECISEKQETTFNVDLPADFDLEGMDLKSWDELELEGVEYVQPWAILQSGSYNARDAMLGYSIKASGIKKAGTKITNTAPNVNNLNTKSKAE